MRDNALIKTLYKRATGGKGIRIGVRTELSDSTKLNDSFADLLIVGLSREMMMLCSAEMR